MSDVDMRTQEIKSICRLLEEVWLNYPHLRLMQLVGNILGNDDHYHREDIELQLGLNAYPDSHPKVPQTFDAAFNAETLLGVADVMQVYTEGRMDAQSALLIMEEVVLPKRQEPHAQLELFPDVA